MFKEKRSRRVAIALLAVLAIGVMYVSALMADARYQDWFNNVMVRGVLYIKGVTTHEGGSPIVFEGATDDAHETTLAITDPTADRVQTVQNVTGTIYCSGGTDVVVADGGTGVSTLTDGGLLVGSGTDPITALGVATNGQIPIGDGTTDPQLATITAVANETDVTNGAGSITIGIVDPLIVGKGGTGAATLTDHSVLVGSGTVAVTPITVGTDGQLLVGSSTADPVFAALTADDGLETTTGAGTLEIDLDLKSNGGAVIESDELAIDLGATAITGTLAVTDGGTGAVALTDHGVLVGSAEDVVTVLAVGATSEVLRGSTGADPAFGALVDGDIPQTLVLESLTVTNDATFSGATIADLGTVSYATAITSAALTVTADATFAGATVADLGTVTTADINAGTLDNVAIGASVSNDATINDLTAETLDVIGSASFTGATIDNLGAVATADINGGTLDGVTIGASVSAAATLSSATIDALTVNTSATFSGATIANLGTVTTADINAGTLDNVVIGGSVSNDATINDATIENLTVELTATFAGATIASLGTVTTGDVTINTLAGTAGEVIGTDGEVNAARIEDKFLKNDAADTTSGILTHNTNQKVVGTHEANAQVMERGTETLSAGTIEVTFGTAFAAAPIVVACYAEAVTTDTSPLYVLGTSTTTCDITSIDTALAYDVNWIAIGDAE